jgi:photosystem II stability/assembly factor-like uncharacterized protein
MNLSLQRFFRRSLSAALTTPLFFSAVILEARFGLDEMQIRAPQPPSNHINTVTHLNGRWIIGDDEGNVSQSEDGIDWSTVSTPYKKAINDITFFNGFYVALGADQSTLLVSDNLVQWELSRPANFNSNPEQLFHYNGELYSVGSLFSLSKTSDLLTWTPVPTGGIERAEGIAWNGSLFVLVGENGEILTSPDLVTWTERQSEIPGIEGLGSSFLFVGWFGDRFLAGGPEGTLMSSADGISWTLVTTPFDDWVYTVEQIGDRFVFPGRQGKIHWTEDFLEWTTVDTSFADTFRDIHFHDGLLMAVGRDGGLAVSSNGADWQLPLDNANPGGFEAVIARDGIFLAADNNGVIHVSNDSEAWLPVFTTVDESGIVGLEYFQNRYVAITRDGRAYSSDDTTTWTEITGPGGRPEGAKVIGADLWVVGREALISKTANLTNWSTVNTGTIQLYDIALGPQGYVAVGREGTVLFSAEGTNWAPVAIDETRNLYTVVHFMGEYRAFGFPGILWESADAETWTLNEDFPRPAYAQEAVIYDGSLILPGYLGDVDVTDDGETWERFAMSSNQLMTDVVVTPERTVVVGGDGTILSSPSNLAPGFAAWRELRFNVLQLLDESVSAPEADPDLDGRSNLVEYFSNSQPLIADPNPAFDFVIETMGERQVPVLTYRRNLAAVDISLSVENSADGAIWVSALEPGSLLGGVASELIQPLDLETEEVTIEFGNALVNQGSVMARFVVTLGAVPAE